MVLFLPLPFFWALFDQQGSRWTYQAQKMDTYIDIANFHLQAEQIQNINSILIIVGVPLFEMVIYPVAAKFGLLIRPLQRMVVGCFLASVAFAVIGAIQVAVQSSNDPLVYDDYSTHRTQVLNLNGCKYSLLANNSFIQTLIPGESIIKLGRANSHTFTVIPSEECSTICNIDTTIKTFVATEAIISTLVLRNRCTTIEWNAATNSWPDDPEFLFHIRAAIYSADNHIENATFYTDSHSPVFTYKSLNETLSYFAIPSPGLYYCEVVLSNGSLVTSPVQTLRQGGVYTFFIDDNGIFKLLLQKTPNQVSAFWQFFPYFIITCGEILVSITGLSFAFSQV